MKLLPTMAVFGSILTPCTYGGLIAHYNFFDSVINTNDENPGVYDLDVVTSGVVVIGNEGAVFLPGGSDYASPNGGHLRVDLSTADLTQSTISFWVRTNAWTSKGNADHVLMSNDNGNNDWVINTKKNGQTTLTSGSASVKINNANLTWTHIALVNDRSVGVNSFNYYKTQNGASTLGTAQTSAALSETNILRFGADTLGGNGFSYDILNLQIYDHALTASEVENIFFQGPVDVTAIPQPPTAIPEPSKSVLLGVGVVVLTRHRRRKSRQIL